MDASLLKLIVFIVELVAQLLPGALQVGESLFRAIESNGDLSDAEKADLTRRVRATKAAVAAYEPRPHAGSPSVDDIPEPPPTAPAR